MKVKLLTTAVCASLALTAWADGARAADALNLSLPATAAGTAALAQSQDAQSQDASQATDEQKKAKELNKIVVTGSLIPRAQIETATPSVQITAEDIKAQGFKSVYEALKSTPFATGGVQGNQDSASFTQGAQTLSLFGLDPGFTLILVDGHPLADYPLLYNGESNFVDLSSIPTAMVDHIDIVPGNQSAIYGSSAIAGVVNIVLKQKVDGIDLGVRVGGYSQGGGASQRISLVGGHSFGKLDAIFGLQYDNSDPIWAYQRNWTDSYLDNPSGNGVASRDRLHLAYSLPDFSYLGYIDPGEHACDGITNLFNGTEKYQYRPGSGYYCGSTETAGYTTLKNKYQDTAGYLSLKMPLGDNAQAYANFIFDHSKVFYNVGSGYTWWGANDGGYFVDANAGQLALAQWAFAPEEVGGYENIGSNQVKDAYNSTIGVRGNFGDSDWAYDAYYDRSQVWVTSHERERMSAKIDAYFENLFLGPQLGEWYGYPVYAPDWDKFYTNAITPEVYRSFTDMLTSKSQSWMQHVNAVFTNTNLFDLPGGSAGIAALVQAGNQHWSLRPDQRFVDGEVWGSVRRTGHG
ncbi:MAG TPA: TonB-dependent receptor, partial [Rhodanobacteraceae bacterium]|nr:TonB-dependent receptor [Rhodanobacteraceae bacterium]